MKIERQRYWGELCKVHNEKNAPLTLSNPSKGNRISANLGPNLNFGSRVEVLINAEIPGVSRNNIAIRISIRENEWKVIEKGGNITEKFDSELRDNPVEKGKYKGGRKIILYKDNVNSENESDWSNQFEWFIENLSLFAELFRSCFQPNLPPFEVPKGNIKDQQELIIDESKEYRLTSSDLLTLRKISQDLQALLARYDN